MPPTRIPTTPTLDELRRRTSEKWRTYPDDVLPLFVAEMDFTIADVVADAIIGQVRTSDIGYAGSVGRVGEVFAGFAERRWGWRPDPAGVRLTTDVSVVIVEALRVLIEPGDTVIINPPVYPPFFDMIPEAGGRVVEVPLISDDAGYRLDVDGIGQAFADGARALLLCSPHNPVGRVHTADELARIAESAAEHGAFVVSDEIHAPLVHRPGDFVPFLAVGDAAREVGVAAHSASKGFNIAGAKCALTVSAGERVGALLDRQPEEVGFRTSILGRAATEAAFEHGDAWLDAVLALIGDNLTLLEEHLALGIPSVTMRRPAASYLAWLDFRATDLGDDPGLPILEQGRVGLHHGPAFGTQGAGFARLNTACSPEVLTEAVDRIARVVLG
ncbi:MULTISPECIES: MalY/PatB family protein [Gordonia]|uniref:MalY/PatB family protein n=1 Tax=Gordonia TaxID=2053 RepID=UPI001FE7880F|nr:MULTISPECIES: aminotransferase class I/II-fold pyridoxal phosphate-dependent enzyme [Gordonia]